MRKAIICPIISAIIYCIMTLLTNLILPSTTRDIVFLLLFALFFCVNIIGLVVTIKVQKNDNLDTEQLKKIRYCKLLNIALVIYQIPATYVMLIYARTLF